MTGEEAIKKLKWFRAYNEDDYCGGDRIQDEHGDWYYRITEQDFEAFEMAIKALEQEPVIDKIRAEIDKIYEREGNSVNCLNALDELKWFIDKYKAESEKV